MIKVAIVEDDKEIRESIGMLLGRSGEIECIGLYERAEDFIKHFPQLEVQVVLMDISLPGMSGIHCVAELKPLKPSIQYLMCTLHHETEQIFDALCAGATGYLLKNASFEQIVEAVKDINNGGSPMSPAIARLVVNSFPDKNKNSLLLETLTSREKEIIFALAKGYQYKEIAEKLFISIETVRTYLRKIYEKLQVRSKVEALNKIFPKGYQ